MCICSLWYPACNAHVHKCICSIQSSMACPAIQYFFSFSHKQHDLKKKLLNTKCVFWFSLQLLSETFLILRRKEQDMPKTVHWSPCKYPLLLSEFNDSWIFLTDFQKILKYQISWISFQCWAELFDADGWTDRQTDRQTDAMKLTVTLSNFVNKPKNQMSHTYVAQNVIVTRNYSAETIINANNLSKCIKEPLNVIKNVLPFYTFTQYKFIYY